jgi:hypothetical protein
MSDPATAPSTRPIALPTGPPVAVPRAEPTVERRRVAMSNSLETARAPMPAGEAGRRRRRRPREGSARSGSTLAPRPDGFRRLDLSRRERWGARKPKHPRQMARPPRRDRDLATPSWAWTMVAGETAIAQCFAGRCARKRNRRASPGAKTRPGRSRRCRRAASIRASLPLASAQSAEYGPGASGSAPITDRHTPRKRPRQSQPTPLSEAWCL